jgi:hypothetical protein
MGLLSRLFGNKDRGAAGDDREGLHIYVRCDRCGEKVHIRANRRTDITQEYDESGDRSKRVLHKEILGSKCQNLMYAHLTLDAADKVIDSRMEGCTLISREEYEAGP